MSNKLRKYTIRHQEGNPTWYKTVKKAIDFYEKGPFKSVSSYCFPFCCSDKNQNRCRECSKKKAFILANLTLLMLNMTCPVLANSVDPDSWLLKEPTDLDLHCLSLYLWISIKNPDQVIWLAGNWKWVWHFKLFSMTRVNWCITVLSLLRTHAYNNYLYGYQNIVPEFS